MYTRRSFLNQTGMAALGASTITVLPLAAHSAAHAAAGMFETDTGSVTIHPVRHASFVMESPAGVIYADPVGEAAMYEGMPSPDLILITHEHGDHYSPDTLAAIMGENTVLITNPAVYDMLPEEMKAKASAMANGDSTSVGEITIDAIPAYNTTEDRLQYHPEGRDNGYVLSIDGRRVYIAGDTEDIPEMRELEDIDIAFVPMNLPYTMDVAQAASGVAAFAPGAVYPYHYRGSDIDEFERLLGEEDVETEVVHGNWYPE